MPNEPVIKFADLRIYLQNRKVPLMPDVIAMHTRYFGKSVSTESARRFFRGDLSPSSISFNVIKATIEGWDNITIDFSGSPYSTEGAPLPRRKI